MYQVVKVGSGASSYEIFNETLSTDFELPTKYEPELMDEIATMIGEHQGTFESRVRAQEDIEA